MPKYSIVVPLHNEQENVTDLYDRLKAVMEANGETFEIVLVDDGSTDRSFHMLREIAAVDSRGYSGEIAPQLWPDFSSGRRLRSRPGRIHHRHGW